LCIDVPAFAATWPTPAAAYPVSSATSFALRRLTVA
jgi:hypothetical protein